MRPFDKKILEAVRRGGSDVDAVMHSLGEVVDKKRLTERLQLLERRGYITGYPGEMRLTKKGYNILFSGMYLIGIEDRVKVKVRVPVKERPSPKIPKTKIENRASETKKALQVKVSADYLSTYAHRLKKSLEHPRGVFEKVQRPGKTVDIKKLSLGRAWKPLLLLIEGALVLLFFFILVNKSAFENIEYFTALTILLVSSVFTGLLFYFKDEDRCYTSSYLSGLMLITTAFALMIRIKALTPTSIIPLIMGVLIILSQAMRFGKLVHNANFWIIAASYAGFWIILAKFSGLGVLGLVLAINTALLIAFLTNSLVKEENQD